MNILSWYKGTHEFSTYGSSPDTPEAIARRKENGFIPMEEAVDNIIRQFSEDRKLHNKWLKSQGHPSIGFTEHSEKSLKHWRIMREVSLGS